MKSFCYASFLIVVLVASMGSVQAESGVPYVGSIQHRGADQYEALEAASLVIFPDGSGPSLTEAVLFGGDTVNAAVVVQLVDIYGWVIPSFPSEDVWLEVQSETIGGCLPFHSGFNADGDSDFEGFMEFAEAPSGGGFSEGPVWVYLNGSQAYDPGGYVFPSLPLRFNSPDINNDGLVNLADVALFAEDFFGDYNYRSDYHWDGALNLVDVGYLAQGLGTSCP